MAVAVPLAGMVTDAAELQRDPFGRPEQTGVTVTAPLLVNPFCDVNVNVVEPVCPGLGTGTVVGFAEIVKLGAALTVSVMLLEVEPE
jgi:hypothetical protein